MYVCVVFVELSVVEQFVMDVTTREAACPAEIPE